MLVATYHCCIVIVVVLAAPVKHFRGLFGAVSAIFVFIAAVCKYAIRSEYSNKCDNSMEGSFAPIKPASKLTSSSVSEPILKPEWH
jgi:hypothetical protein